MFDVLIHVWPEVTLTDVVKGAKGVHVTVNRVGMEGNEDDVLHSCRYYL